VQYQKLAADFQNDLAASGLRNPRARKTGFESARAPAFAEGIVVPKRHPP